MNDQDMPSDAGSSSVSLPQSAAQLLLAAGILVMTVGCNNPGLRRLQLRSPIVLEVMGAEPIQQTAATSSEATPPRLMVPAVGNAAQIGVFEELADLKTEHDRLNQEIADTRTAAENLQAAIESERVDMSSIRTEVDMLQERMLEISNDLEYWKNDVAESRRQFHDQQSRDLAALEELNDTVELLIDQARQIVSEEDVREVEDQLDRWNTTNPPMELFDSTPPESAPQN